MLRISSSLYVERTRPQTMPPAVLTMQNKLHGSLPNSMAMGLHWRLVGPPELCCLVTTLDMILAEVVFSSSLAGRHRYMSC